jgi:hypothetical protein
MFFLPHVMDKMFRKRWIVRMCMLWSEAICMRVSSESLPPKFCATPKTCLHHVSHHHHTLSLHIHILTLTHFFVFKWNSIGGVIVIVLASSVVERGFVPRSYQTKEYEIGICCFSAKHAALRRKSKVWLARNQNNWNSLPLNTMLSDCWVIQIGCFSH